MGRRKSGSYTQERDVLLFRKYLSILKRNREVYKEVARSISVTDVYAEVGDLFKISSGRVGHIICRMLKTPFNENNITLQEYDEYVKELEHFTPSKLERSVEGLNHILMQVGISKSHEEVKRLAQEFLIKGE